MKLTVKPPTGDAITMDVDSSMTVADFRQNVAEKVGEPKDSIRNSLGSSIPNLFFDNRQLLGLVSSGHVLKDEKTLAEHNVAEGGMTKF